MMQDYDRTMELVNAANNSAGASEEQFGKTLDSLDAKLNGLSNAWQELTMTLANQEAVKGIVDILTSLLNIVNAFMDGAAGLGEGWLSAINSIYNAILLVKNLSIILQPIFQKLIDSLMLMIKSSFNRLGREAGREFSNGLNSETKKADLKGTVSAIESVSTESNKFKQIIAGTIQGVKMLGKAGANSFKNFFSTIKNGSTSFKKLKDDITNAEKELEDAKKIDTLDKNGNIDEAKAKNKADAIEAAEVDLNKKKAELQDYDNNLSKTANAVRGLGASLSMATAYFADLTEESSVFTSTLLSGLSPVVNQVGNLIGGVVELGRVEMQQGIQALLAGQMTGQAMTAALGVIGLVIQAFVTVIQIISAIINATKEAEKAERERRREAEKARQEELDKKNEEIDKNEELYQSYRDVYEKYKETGEGKDELINSTVELMRAYGKEYDIVRLLSGGYEEYANRISEARKAELEQKSENLKTKATSELAILELDFKDKGLTKKSKDFEAAGISLTPKDLKGVQEDRERALDLIDKESTSEELKELLTKYLKATEGAAEVASEIYEEQENLFAEMGQIAVAKFEDEFGKEVDNTSFQGIYNSLFEEISKKYKEVYGDVNEAELTEAVTEIINGILVNSGYQDELALQETLKYFENFSNEEKKTVEGILNKIEDSFGEEQLNNFIYEMPEYAKASKEGLELYYDIFSRQAQDQFDKEVTVDASIKIKTVLETDFGDMSDTEIEKFVSELLDDSPILADKSVLLNVLAGTGFTDFKEFVEFLLKGGNKLDFAKTMTEIADLSIKSADDYKKQQESYANLYKERVDKAKEAYENTPADQSDREILERGLGKEEIDKLSDEEVAEKAKEYLNLDTTDIDITYASLDEAKKALDKQDEIYQKEPKESVMVDDPYLGSYLQMVETPKAVEALKKGREIAPQRDALIKQELEQARENAGKKDKAAKELQESNEDYERVVAQSDESLLETILGDAEAMGKGLETYTNALNYLSEMKVDTEDLEISLENYEQLIKDIPELANVKGITYKDGMVQISEEFKDIVDNEYDTMDANAERYREQVLSNIEELERLNDTIGLTAEQYQKYQGLVTDYNASLRQSALREFEQQKAAVEKQKKAKQEEIDQLEKQKAKLEEQKALLESILNTYSYTYNQLQKINAAQRKRNQLEWEYNNLQNEGGNGADRLKNLQKQIDTYKKEISNVTLSIQKNMGRIGEIQDQYSEFAGLVNYNDATGEIILSSDIYDANKTFGDQETADRFNKYIEELQAAVDEREDNRDQLRSIYDSINEIKNQVRENAANFYNRVMEALVDKYQKQIDQLTELNDSMNDYNQSVIDGIQKSIDKERQEKRNKDTEDSIAEKQRKISVLSRDTSGANALAIKKLQKEIEDDQENYLENLVDQKLTELQDQNELAYEQRQKQLEMMQENLDWQQQTGVLWNEVEDLIAKGMGDDGTLLKGSDLETVLKSKDGFEGLNKLDKANWMTEVNSGVADVYTYLNSGGSGSLFRDIDKAKSGIVSALGSETEEIKTSLTPIASGIETANKKLGSYNKKISNISSSIDALNTEIGELSTSIDGLTAQLAKQKPAEEINQVIIAPMFSTAEPDELFKEYGAFISSFEVGKLAAQGNVATAYATGGLNTETGIAWLDGTPSKPELVLNATDTQNMLKIVEIMRDKKLLTGEKLTGQTQNYFSIAMNVEEIASDYDVDELTERMIEKINDIARSRNNTILI